MLRGKAIALAALIIVSSLPFASPPGISGATDPHEPIVIKSDADFATCGCVRAGNGSASNPFIISDWRIVDDKGVAIQIQGVSKHFIVRDNTLVARVGVVLKYIGDRGQIIGNDIDMEWDGIRTVSSSPRITNNIIQGPPGDNYWSDAGIEIHGGSPIVKANLLTRSQHGLTAEGSSALIEDNEFVNHHDALVLTGGTRANLTGNIIRLAEHWGLVVENSARATLIDNAVRDGRGGIIVESATLYMEGNTVINQDREAVRFDHSAVQMFRNEVVNNWRGAFGSTNSDVLIQENTFSNNQDIGIRLTDSVGRVKANTLHDNEVGIKVDRSMVEIEDNRLYNNTYGFSLPYEARQMARLMSGNIVNGVNVDGTITPSEQRIFYKTENLRISGQRIDAGNDEGFYGSLFEQGALLIYDSEDITLDANTFVHMDTGIQVEGSSYVRIRGNDFRNVDRAVISHDSRTFVKNNTCIIEIDPEGTVCVTAGGDAFVSIRNNTLANVDIGILLDSEGNVAARAVVEGNTALRTRVGIRAEGSPFQSEHDVILENNTILEAQLGLELVRFHGTVRANLIANNTWAAAHLEGRTNATIIGNRILFNGMGIVDVGTCDAHTRTHCSTGVFIDNEVRGNAGVGIETHNGGTFEGGVIADNELGIHVSGRAVFEDVNASGNEKDGIRVEGRAIIKGSNASDNGRHGIFVRGAALVEDTNASGNEHDGISTEGRVRIDGGDARFNGEAGVYARGEARITHHNASHNDHAGYRLEGTVFRLYQCEASFNAHGVIMAEALVDVHVGVPDIQLPTVEIPDLPDVQNPDLGGEDQDPLWMSYCNLTHNSRFALKASVESVINATLNYWGPEGPRLSTPLIPRANTIEATGLFTPYWQDRQHREVGFVMTTGAGPDGDPT